MGLMFTGEKRDLPEEDLLTNLYLPSSLSRCISHLQWENNYQIKLNFMIFHSCFATSLSVSWPFLPPSSANSKWSLDVNLALNLFKTWIMLINKAVFVCFRPFILPHHWWGSRHASPEYGSLTCEVFWAQGVWEYGRGRKVTSIFSLALSLFPEMGHKTNLWKILSLYQEKGRLSYHQRRGIGSQEIYTNKSC